MTTPRRLRRILGAALTLALVAAPAATAADRTTTLGPGPGSYKWTATGSGWYTYSTVYDEIPCEAGNDCDDTLIRLNAAGTLSVDSRAAGPNNADTAVKLFESDESGTVGKQLRSQDGGEPTADESFAAELEPGWYIVRIMFLASVAGSSNTEAKFEPLPVEAAPVAPVAPVAEAPAPNAAPTAKASVRSSNRSKSLRSLRGSAADTDGTVSKVEIALVSKKGSKCKQMTSRGSFKRSSCSKPTTWLTAKGTDRWSYKLRKRLAKGSYVVFVRATDDKGAVSEKPARRSFRVK